MAKAQAQVIALEADLSAQQRSLLVLIGDGTALPPAVSGAFAILLITGEASRLLHQGRTARAAE